LVGTFLIYLLNPPYIYFSRYKKSILLIIGDIAFSLLALWSAFSLRLGELYAPKDQIVWLFLIAPFIVIPIFIRFGLYRAILRYIELNALWTMIQAISLYALIVAALMFHFNDIQVPKTVPALNWMLMLLLIAGSRFLMRWWLNEAYFNWHPNYHYPTFPRKNVIIYGAGQAGAQLASALVHGREFNAVAFIDDNRLLHRHKINHLKIYGISALADLIERYQVTDILLAIPSATRARRSDIIRVLEAYGIHVRSVPSITEIANGKVSFDAIQEVDIADLLGRDCVPPQLSLLQANIQNKVVMVTGAGGSIGAELCRQIIHLQPRYLILFELNEFQLYSIHQQLLRLADKHIRLIAILGSVIQQQRLYRLCHHFKVQTIYHAAAYKHVPLVEHNPGEAIWTNIFGTLHLAQAAIRSGVETFVLISSDKAVRPTNTMGATKRFAELLLQALSQHPQSNQRTRFTMVRFGNVLGSSGSVVPLFREQIARGGPVTVTDPRIIRYFMTIPEAAELVIQAGALGEGGEVFVLDMGEPVKIVELAKRMIRLSGFEVKDANHPNGDIEIRYIGLRPGEKLYEELLIGDSVFLTVHEKIRCVQEKIIPWEQLNPLLKQLNRAIRQYDYELARNILQQAIPEFQPLCPVMDEINHYAQTQSSFNQ
jgi:FlaA1/EpsC-like NDP-sugar epimerase